MIGKSGHRRGAGAVALIVVVATAAGAALAPQDLRARLMSAIDGEAAAGAVPVAPANVPQPVRASVIRLTAPGLSATYTGTVRPRIESPMGFRVGGKVAQRLVDVGDRVAAGQVIARLDDRDLALSLQAALAEKAAAETDLARAQAAVERTRTLKAEGHVAQAALDGAESDAAQARGRLDRALSSVDLARNGLTYATLTADAAGVVTTVSAEAGQVVAAGQPVATLAPTDAPEAEIALPEQRRADLERGRAVAVLWGEEGTAYPLTLREVSPDVDPATRTYRVRLAFAPGAAPDLGRTVTVTLEAGGTAPVATLPLASVHDDGTGTAVWRLDPSGTRVARVPVTLASVGPDAVQVRGALSDGDRVVSLGAQRIDPDRPVKVVETAPAAEF